MKCEDLLRALGDYVDGEIDPSFCKQFERHLAGCDPCQVVVDNIRRTIQLYKDGAPYDLPAEFQQALNQLLRQRWEAKFPKPAGGASERGGPHAAHE